MWWLLLQIGCQSKEEVNDTAEPVFYEVSGQVLQVIGGAGIEGVQICQSPQGECTTSDEDGQYQIAIQQTDNLQIQYTHSDYVSGLVALPTVESGMMIPNVSLISPDLLTAQMSAVELTWTAGTGLVAFSVSNGIFGDGINISDIQISLSPTGGDGPFYTNSIGLPTADLAATSDNGGGVWVNLPPQTYEFTHQGIPADCTTMLGWGTPYQMQVPVVADNVTYVRIECLVEE